MAQLKLDIREVSGLVQSIFRRAGVPAGDAELVADCLISADVCGLSSHGLMRTKPYVQRIRSGLTNPTPHITHRRAAENMFQVNGDNALGQVATMYALDLCMAQARKSGNAIATINHMNHLGMASFYTKKAAAERHALIRKLFNCRRAAMAERSCRPPFSLTFHSLVVAR